MFHRLLVAVVPLMVSSCTSASLPEIVDTRDPADPTIEVRPTHHHSPLAGHVARLPVGPQPWLKINSTIAGEAGDGS